MAWTGRRLAPRKCWMWRPWWRPLCAEADRTAWLVAIGWMFARRSLGRGMQDDDCRVIRVAEVNGRATVDRRS